MNIDSDIYLDNSATTPVLPEAAELAAAVMCRDYGNPSSLHRKGFEAQLVLERAREQVASALGCAPPQVFFSPSGTVANNLAILGSVGAYAKRLKGKTPRLVTTAIEHSSVLRPLERLAGQGMELVLIKPDGNGNIAPEALAEAVNENTLLVSAMAVNSETGAVLDIGRLCRLVRAQNAATLIHCDGVQAFGKGPVLPLKWDVDYCTVSGHKIRAPKGVGALYVKKGLRLTPLYQGGEQEKGLLPGTENTPAIAAFGLAAQMRMAQLPAVEALFVRLRAQLEAALAKIPGLCNNSPDGSAPYIMNISLPGIRSETMIHFLAQRGIYVSSGSACARGAKSHVLTAMGLADDRIDSALRLSFGCQNTPEDIAAFVAALQEGLAALKRKSSDGNGK